MEKAERYLQEYGSVSISVPLLSKLNSADYRFDLQRGTTNYYIDAKTQVQTAAAEFNQFVHSLSLDLRAEANPTVMAAYTAQLTDYFSSLQRYQTKQGLLDMAAEAQYKALLAAATNDAQRAQAILAYAQQYPGNTNRPAYPVADSTNTNLPDSGSNLPRPTITNVLSNQQFSGFQGLLSSLKNSSTPTLDDRSAIITAAGDQATESIFRHFMGNTNLVKDSAEDNVYFGFSTVSVNPGWRTQKGWAAEVIMTAEIYYTTGRLSVVREVYDQVKDEHLNGETTLGLYNEYGGNVSTESDLAFHLKQQTNDAAVITNIMVTTQMVTTNIIAFQTDYTLNTQKNWVTNLTVISIPVITNEELVSITKPNPFLHPLDRLNGVEIIETNVVPKTNFISQTNIVSILESSTSKSNTVISPKLLSYDIPVYTTNVTVHPNYNPPAFWRVTDDDFLKNPIPVPVTVISPLVDAQAEDLAFSSRSQKEFALALSFALHYAGVTAQAKAFDQLIKSRQFDLNTRSESIAVNAFSGADGKFGFQIGARVKALGDPSAKNPAPAQILERKSFPALLIIPLGAADLTPKLWQYDPSTNKIRVMEPQIRFTQMRRWTPMKHLWDRDGLWIFNPVDWANQPFTERNRMNALADLQAARADLAQSSLRPAATNTILKRIENLESQLSGGEGRVFLAASDIVPAKPVKPVTVSINGLAPEEIAISSTNPPVITQLAVLGTGLDQVELKAAVNVLPASFASQFDVKVDKVTRVAGTLLLSISFNAGKIANLDGKAFVLNFTTTNATTVLSLPITVAAKIPAASPPRPPPPPHSTMTFSNTGTNNGGFNYTVFLPTNSASTVNFLGLSRDLIKADLEKNKPGTGSTNTQLELKPDVTDTNKPPKK